VRRGRLVVLGIAAQVPFAGVAWQALHYLEGFRRLGYDVYYVEDTGAWPYDPERRTITDDPSYAVRYLGALMARAGCGDRWAYCPPGRPGGPLGPSAAALTAVWRGADVLVNLTGATVLRGEHLRVPVRIYLETDPVAPQIEVALGRRFTIDLLAAHTHHASYAENLGTAECGVPVGQFTYLPTRPPVVLEWWRSGAPAGARFTTVAAWRQTGRDVWWNGERYGWSKDEEFLKVLDLPRRTRQPLELALACEDEPTLRLLRSNGWLIRDAISLTTAPAPYHAYIEESRGEFTVAKDQNVRLRSGWFSDRSACYLAAGRPVVTQDTGFGRVLPVGRGLFAFRDGDEAASALETVGADYEGHAGAAREVADGYFRAERVLEELMDRVGA